MKTSYRDGDWPSFFGYAQYYRKRWPVNERNQTQLLELLALLRHCQNDLVSHLVNAYKPLLPKFLNQLNQIEALSKTKFKGKPAEDKSTGDLKNHFEGVSVWPLPAKQIANVHPKNLKIKVGNQCLF